MRAGLLKYQITIQKKQTTKDNDGFSSENWIDHAIIWAAKYGLSGREYYSAATTQAENDIKFIIRFRQGLNTKMRIVEDKKIYNIKSIIDKNGDKRWLEVRACEVI